MKLAIVGSRELNKEQAEIVRAHCRSNLAGAEELITGGAKGVDTIAYEVAKEMSLPIFIVRPADPRVKKDYILRNFKIVDLSDKVIAFWDGKSKGTESVIKYCKKIKKDLLIIRFIKQPRFF